MAHYDQPPSRRDVLRLASGLAMAGALSSLSFGGKTSAYAADTVGFESDREYAELVKNPYPMTFKLSADGLCVDFIAPGSSLRAHLTENSRTWQVHNAAKFMHREAEFFMGIVPYPNSNLKGLKAINHLINDMRPFWVGISEESKADAYSAGKLEKLNKLNLPKGVEGVWSLRVNVSGGVKVSSASFFTLLAPIPEGVFYISFAAAKNAEIFQNTICKSLKFTQEEKSNPPAHYARLLYPLADEFIVCAFEVPTGYFEKEKPAYGAPMLWQSNDGGSLRYEYSETPPDQTLNLEKAVQGILVSLKENPKSYHVSEREYPKARSYQKGYSYVTVEEPGDGSTDFRLQYSESAMICQRNKCYKLAFSSILLTAQSKEELLARLEDKSIAEAVNRAHTKATKVLESFRCWSAPRDNK